MAEHLNTGAVAAAIPFGRENAISRAELAQKLGMSDRKMREAVEDARLDGLIIINTQNGGGYFQTTDLDEMKRQYDQDTSRALSILRRRKPLREALIAAGVNVRHYGGQAMLQYCRYCSNAIDYNGEATDFLCEAEAPCGNNGSGRFYPASKAKRPNKCPYFSFNPNDLFRYDERGNFVQYKPREAKEPTQAQGEQLSLL